MGVSPMVFRNGRDARATWHWPCPPIPAITPAMRRLFLRDCAAGDVIEDVFIITNKQLAATSSGKHYIKAYCSDRTAQLNVRIWNATREMFSAMPDGGFLRIRGRVENYQNNLQV